jgi:Skp family chaperone for outer membrane proteins
MALVVGVLGLSLPRRTDAQLKVGMVDLQAVMERSVRAKAAKARLQALHDQLQHALQAKAEIKQHQEAELQRLQTALQTHAEAVTTQARGRSRRLSPARAGAATFDRGYQAIYG